MNKLTKVKTIILINIFLEIWGIIVSVLAGNYIAGCWAFIAFIWTVTMYATTSWDLGDWSHDLKQEEINEQLHIEELNNQAQNKF